MAIDLHHWKMILAANVKGRALSAGYPDMLVDFPDAPKRADSAEIAAHHGVKHAIADSVEVFRSAGLELTVIDRAVYRGGEIVVDLNNRPLPDEDDGSPYGIRLDDPDGYDLVIDPGTSEHCFNIAQALVNLADAVKVGGVISQALPMAMFNHGYWNVNPVALLDFYEENGFAIERMVIRHGGGIFEPKEAERGMRMKDVPDGAVNIITARRLEKRPFRWPQQKA